MLASRPHTTTYILPLRLLRPSLPPRSPSPSPFAFPHHPDLLDLYLPADPFFASPPIPSPHAFLLHDLTDRIAALEIAARAAALQLARRKYTYAATEPDGRKVKWAAEEKPRGEGRALKWEVELVSPNDDGFDRKWRWEAKSKGGAGGKIEEIPEDNTAGCDAIRKAQLLWQDREDAERKKVRDQHTQTHVVHTQTNKGNEEVAA